jgi:hypothetical protein
MLLSNPDTSKKSNFCILVLFSFLDIAYICEPYMSAGVVAIADEALKPRNTTHG